MWVAPNVREYVCDVFMDSIPETLEQLREDENAIAGETMRDIIWYCPHCDGTHRDKK